MTNLHLFHRVSVRTSKMIAESYSTSFSLGIRLMKKKFHDPIYSIYGFVRLADEIVDTFHGHEKGKLLARFREDTQEAIKLGISLNPVLHSFQRVVNTYGIDIHLIETFLNSMEMDIHKKSYTHGDYADYILGSAEVVGLMCLKVFCEGDEQRYESLKKPAMKLGSAFQKINFLRDLTSDYKQLGRIYFPGLDIDRLDAGVKKEIEADIEKDFRAGREGIFRLPRGVRFGVYVAYVYYYKLFNKIKGLPPATILNERVRIPDFQKYMLLLKSCLRYSLHMF